GCPHPCTFCTIINVQGRDPRWRNPEDIINFVREQCEIYGQASFFFTDDNYVRNRKWEVIFDGLIALRAQGHSISFMLEADLHCGDEPRFLEKAAAAGCTQIFMGVESMNKKNLKSARKNQNHVDMYEKLWNRCRQLGIGVHAGYIIGFPYDTPASVAADIERLTSLGADQVSLFMLTPLPGSEDHIRAYCAGVPMEADFNGYDSFQPVWEHPAAAGVTPMTRAEWLDTYCRAWKQIYSVRNMVRMLRRHSNRHTRRCLIKNYIWYRWAVFTEKSHPMVAGLYRWRSWNERRPNAAPIPLTQYIASEIWRHLCYLGCFLKEFYIFQHVFYEVEVVPYLTERQAYLTGELRGASDWLARTFWQPMNRRWLNSFWIQYGRQKWNLLKLWRWRSWLWHLSMLPYAVTETVYTSRWLFCFRRLIVEVK
ncbi:MAG: radical SAM protein, partial [Patescibacteria group bacterium]